MVIDAAESGQGDHLLRHELGHVRQNQKIGLTGGHPGDRLRILQTNGLEQGKIPLQGQVFQRIDARSLGIRDRDHPGDGFALIDQGLEGIRPKGRLSDEKDSHPRHSSALHPMKGSILPVNFLPSPFGRRHF
jgi:hypothetical protein